MSAPATGEVLSLPDTGEAVVNRLHKEIIAALREPDVKEAFAQRGADVALLGGSFTTLPLFVPAP